MKNEYLIAFIIMGCLFVNTACSDNSANAGTGPQHSVTISGKITAPNGKTPLSGATVFVNTVGKKGVKAVIGSSAGAVGQCEEPEEDYTAYTCTEPDGTFSFNIQTQKDQVVLNIQKGQFSFQKKVDVSGSKSEAGEITMPTGTKLGTKIAVVTGSFDRMQDVLAKLGFGDVGTSQSGLDYGHLILGTETFDLYNGDGMLPSNYPEFSDLFKDNDGDGQADIFKYDIVFINCGAMEESFNTVAGSAAGTSPKKHHPSRRRTVAATIGTQLSVQDIQLIQQFVQKGGMLYATDWAYDYVEQSFPKYIDFLGSDSTPADQPEEPLVAEQGNTGLEIDADILEPSLRQYLAAVDCNDGEPCLNTDNTVHITDFLIDWVVINDVQNPGTKVWVKGHVSYIDGDGIRPLTVTFNVGKGQVVYSSYHTTGTPHRYWHAQERILQYLVFE